jgi:hypothetical protein
MPPEPPAWCIEMEKRPQNKAKWKQWLVDYASEKIRRCSRRRDAFIVDDRPD